MIFPGAPGMFSDIGHAACNHIGKGPRGDSITVETITGEGTYRLQFKNERTGEVYAITPNLYVSSSSDPTIYTRLSDIEKKTDTVASLKSYGAVGDGTTDDTDALGAAFSSGKTIICDGSATYKVSPYLHISNANGTIIIGNGAHVVADISDSNNNEPIIEFRDSSNIYINGLEVYSNGSYSVDQLNTFAPHGIAFDGSGANNYIVGCTIHNVKDGISMNYINGAFILQNYIYHIGQEPCAIRFNNGCIVSENIMRDHGGDGLLCKSYLSNDYSNIIITDNILTDGYHRTNGNSGGGITCNAELVSNAHITKGVVIANNIVTNCRYGIIVGNIQDCVIANNFCSPHPKVDQSGFYDGTACYGIGTHPGDNPQNPNTSKNVLFIGNIAVGGWIQFMTYRNVSTDTPLEKIKFISNVGYEHPTVKSMICIQAKNSLFVGNDVSCSGIRLCNSYDCEFIDNVFECTDYTPEQPKVSDIYFRANTETIIRNNIFKVNQIYVNCVSGEFTGNSIFVQGTNSSPLKLATTGEIYAYRNTVDKRAITKDQIYMTDPTKVFTDIKIVKKTNIICNSDSNAYGYILKDNDYTYLTYNGPFSPGEFATAETTFGFKPPEFKQIIAFMHDSENTNIVIGRVTYRTDGKLYAMEYGNLGNGGNVMISQMFPNTKEAI